MRIVLDFQIRSVTIQILYQSGISLSIRTAQHALNFMKQS